MNPRDLEPFRSPLVSAGLGKGWLNTPEDAPYHIVRDEDNVNPETSTKALHEVSQLLTELDEKYGIKNPGYYPVVAGENIESSKAYVVVPRVDGVSLAEAASTGKPEVLQQIDELYSSLAKYLVDKADNDESYMTDVLSDDQYMFGHVDGETQNRIYLVDVGVLIGKPNSYCKYAGIVPDACSLFQDVMNMALRTNHHFDAVEHIVNLLNYLDVDNDILKRLIKLVNDAYDRKKSISDDELDTLIDQP